MHLEKILIIGVAEKGLHYVADIWLTMDIWVTYDGR